MLTDTEKTQLDERGFTVLRDVISADEVNELRRLSLALATDERSAGCGSMYLDDCAQRVWNLVNKGESFEQAIQHPRILAAMEYLLGEDCTLSSFTVNIIGPGASNGHLHIDYPLRLMPDPRPSFPLVANSVWLLDDFTLENGATRCVPGSHLRLKGGPEADVKYDDEVQVCGSKGSVLIVNGALWHGSSANHTDGDRVGLLGFFCRAFMKPQQDHLKLASDEVVSRATPVLTRLLGFDSMPSATP
ncbi:MAG: phytanoyl-CoA dioxygenase family protein [Candidatus Poribacteria bacterium]|nr:phytanoyl-CoA dioxygenase family protein [Candidatus Poribacteria bacterium]MDE0503894.1 phytanoyl-CoA dioxygenase family protein [Candidatus Poribacteria bacterium]